MKAFQKFRQYFTVSFEYPVIFTHNIFDPTNTILLKTIGRLKERCKHRTLIFVDSNVVRCHTDLIQKIQTYFKIHAHRLELVLPPRVVPGGESIKSNLKPVFEIIHTALDQRLCRHSYIIAIGGGAVLDAVGIATSLIHRGLRLIRLPTTVLSQNDAGVGIKNGLNLSGAKNTIGTFAPPFAVLNDFSFLITLPEDAWRGGIAEAFKVAIIADAKFFRFLCRNAPRFRKRDEPLMEHLIIRCAGLHLKHIRTSGDPFEFGQVRPLDFGHWAAHKLEAMSKYNIPHGQAVALGIVLDSFYALQKGWISQKEFDSIHKGLTQCGFVLWSSKLERLTHYGTLEILEGLKNFQEHLGGTLCITFPKRIGKKIEVQEIETALIEKAVRYLKGAYSL